MLDKWPKNKEWRPRVARREQRSLANLPLASPLTFVTHSRTSTAITKNNGVHGRIPASLLAEWDVPLPEAHMRPQRFQLRVYINMPRLHRALLLETFMSNGAKFMRPHTVHCQCQQLRYLSDVLKKPERKYLVDGARHMAVIGPDRPSFLRGVGRLEVAVLVRAIEDICEHRMRRENRDVRLRDIVLELGDLFAEQFVPFLHSLAHCLLQGDSRHYKPRLDTDEITISGHKPSGALSMGGTSTNTNCFAPVLAWSARAASMTLSTLSVKTSFSLVSLMPKKSAILRHK